MIVNRLNAVAVDPLAWHPVREAEAKRRVAERLNSMEHLVGKIVAPFDRAATAGRTEERLAEIVAQWAGPLAKWIHVDACRGSKARTLKLRADNPALIQTLRPRLPELIEALKDTGISQVKM
jgi:hypothetical protein